MAESDVQMKLAQDAGFLARIQYLMIQQARVVLAESGIGTTHVARANHAVLVIRFPPEYAAKASPMIVGGTNLLSPNATTTINGDGSVTTSASDASILSQISSFWNSLAGIDTGN